MMKLSASLKNTYVDMHTCSHKYNGGVPGDGGGLMEPVPFYMLEQRVVEVVKGEG